MADNVTLDPGAGGATVATDDVGGVHYQRVKLDGGGDGSATAIAAGGGVEAGALRVTIANDSTGVVSIDDNGGNLSIDDGGNSITVDNATISVVGGGTEAAAQRVTIASDSTGVLSVDDNGSSLTVDNGGTFAVQDSEKLADDAAFTVGTTKVNPVGFLADQTSTDSVNEGDVGAARITLDRKQIVTLAPSADTEGHSVSNNIDIDETEDAVKASAGKLYGWYLYNDGASEVYVKFYNDTTANVVVGTTVPHMTIPVPAGAAANVEWANGITFSAAITVAATTGVATADTGAPAANQVVGCILYQ